MKLEESRTKAEQRGRTANQKNEARSEANQRNRKARQNRQAKQTYRQNIHAKKIGRTGAQKPGTLAMQQIYLVGGNKERHTVQRKIAIRLERTWPHAQTISVQEEP